MARLSTPAKATQAAELSRATRVIVTKVTTNCGTMFSRPNKWLYAQKNIHEQAALKENEK